MFGETHRQQASEVYDLLNEITAGIEGALGIADNLILFGSLVLSLVVCFVGFRIYRIVVALIGFQIGAPIGALLFGLITGEMEGAIVGAIVVGLAAAVIAWRVRRLAIAVLGFAAGFVVLGALVLAASGDGQAGLLGGIIGGILGGIIAVKIDTIVIVISTALTGATPAGGVLAYWLTQAGAVQRMWTDLTALLLSVVLLIGGAVVQFRFIRQEKLSSTVATRGRRLPSGADQPAPRFSQGPRATDESPGPFEQVLELQELLRKGYITREQFEERRRQIYGQTRT